MSTPRGGLIDGKHGFCELVALDQLRALLEKFTKTTGLVAWVASYPEQEPLIDGWRTICGDFHCGSSGSERRCRESRAQLVASLSESGRTVIRACGNGLNDGAVPIVVRGVRAATVLAGQVLFEAPDRDRFRRQAEAHGYDVGAYLAALEEVPVVSEAEFRRSLAFLADVVEAMAERGLRELERGGSAELAERQRITLHSIVDAVIATDADGRVVDMNPVAETLTGWRLEQAAGKELAEIFVLVNAHTRSPVANPVDHVIESGAVVGMANHTILIARGGRELQIADSAAPIRDASGRILGVVMVFRDVTEEYARQEELQRALRFNEALLYAIPTPVFFKGADGRYLGCNRAFTEIMGVTSEQIRGKTVHELWPSEHAHVYHEADLRLMANPEHQTYEFEVKDKDGLVRPVIYAKDVFRDGLGNVAGVVGAFLDVTDRRRAEEALRAKTEELEQFFLSALELLCITNKKGCFLRLNREWETVLGYGLEELEAMCLLDLIHPLDEGVARGELVKLGATDGTLEFTCRCLRKDGSVRWLEWRAVPHGELIYASARDVTDRKRSEDQLRRTLERQQREMEVVAAVALSGHLSRGEVPELARQLTDAAARALEVERVGVWLFAKGQTELHNVDNFQLSTGVHASGAVLQEKDFASEFAALKSAKFVDADDPLTDPRTAGYVEVYLKPNRITSMLDAVIRRGGESLGVLCFEHVDRPHHWEEDEVSFACQLADQIALALSNLAFRRVQEERAQLEEHYRRSQKLESIGRLAGGVAHDLNNLLTPILAYSDMVLEGLPADDPGRGMMRQVLGAGERARDLVQQLLAFGRKQMLAYKRADLNEVVRRMLGLLKRTIPEDIRMEVNLTRTALTVTVDVGQIEQVLLNLAVNAADAMPDGGILTIETALVDLDDAYVQTHSDVEPGPHAQLAVSDTGHGMDRETQRHIFEPFFSTKGSSGTGLGLATAYGIVKQHGGNIWVYSEPGTGSIFKVHLPVAAEVAQAEQRSAGTPVANPLGGSEAVLVVEDNEHVRELACAILRSKGYQVLCAEDGEQALAVLAGFEGSVDLLLTDVVMPGMNGRDLFERASRTYPNMRVLYMSGYTYDVVAHRGVLEPGVCFIQKPFTVETLAAKAREVLDKGHS